MIKNKRFIRRGVLTVIDCGGNEYIVFDDKNFTLYGYDKSEEGKLLIYRKVFDYEKLKHGFNYEIRFNKNDKKCKNYWIYNIIPVFSDKHGIVLRCEVWRNYEYKRFMHNVEVLTNYVILDNKLLFKKKKVKCLC